MVDVMDIVGYVFVGLIFVASAVISIYLFVHFSHPLDADFICAYFVKVFIIIGMTVSAMMVFIVPVDFLSTWKV
jgi:hypothetical protein